MADLKTNYVDDILNVSANTRRKYNMITNDDGTVSFEDVTDYTQIGDVFGSKDVNEIATAINQINSDLGSIRYILLHNKQYEPYNKPWRFIKEAAENLSLIPGNSYIGRIIDGAQYDFFGTVTNDKYAIFHIICYSVQRSDPTIIIVQCYDGIWTYGKLDIPLVSTEF